MRKAGLHLKTSSFLLVEMVRLAYCNCAFSKMGVFDISDLRLSDL